MSVFDRVHRFVIDEIGWKDAPDDLVADTPLMEAGVFDSMGVFHLISFLEDEFDIEVLDEDLVPDNFATIATIEHLVARRGGVPNESGIA